MTARPSGSGATGEFALIERFFSDWREEPEPGDAGSGATPILGVGDDAAIWEDAPGFRSVVSVDTMVEGTHFFPGHPPRALGWKALAAAASDLAAMGATPNGFLLALTLPRAETAWVAAFADGLRAAAQAFGLRLLGGDTTRGPLTIGITVLGNLRATSRPSMTRAAARPGDWLFVSGVLGGASAGLQALAADRGLQADATTVDATPKVLQRLFWPVPRLRLGVWLGARANAAIDLSDGLLADAGHVARASGLVGELWLPAIPADPALSGLPPDAAARGLLAGGEDYELLWSVAAPDRAAALKAMAAAPSDGGRAARPVCIGRLRLPSDGERPQVRLLDASGQVVPMDSVAGHDHFASD